MFFVGDKCVVRDSHSHPNLDYGNEQNNKLDFGEHALSFRQSAVQGCNKEHGAKELESYCLP